jgi:RecA-family ATPase
MARSSTGLARESDGQQNDSKVGYEKVPILSSRDLMFRTSNFSVRKQSVRILYGLQKKIKKSLVKWKIHRIFVKVKITSYELWLED